MVGTGVNLVLAIHHHRRLIENREREEEYEKKRNMDSESIKEINKNSLEKLSRPNNTKNHDNIFLEIFKIW